MLKIEISFLIPSVNVIFNLVISKNNNICNNLKNNKLKNSIKINHYHNSFRKFLDKMMILQ